MRRGVKVLMIGLGVLVAVLFVEWRVREIVRCHAEVQHRTAIELAYIQDPGSEADRFLTLARSRVTMHCGLLNLPLIG
jgi:hypothetical protein